MEEGRPPFRHHLRYAPIVHFSAAGLFFHARLRDSAVWLIADLIRPSFVSTVDLDFRRPPHPSQIVYLPSGHRATPSHRSQGDSPHSSSSSRLFSFSFPHLGRWIACGGSKKEKRFAEETFETREPFGVKGKLSLSVSPRLRSDL